MTLFASPLAFRPKPTTPFPSTTHGPSSQRPPSSSTSTAINSAPHGSTMAPVTNYFLVRELEARAVTYENQMPMQVDEADRLDVGRTIYRLLQRFETHLRNNAAEHVHSFFNLADCLQALAWKHQAEKDPSKQWGPRTDEPDGEAFRRWLEGRGLGYASLSVGVCRLIIHTWSAEAKEARRLDWIKVNNANAGGRDGKAAYGRAKVEDRVTVEVFYLMRCAREFYGY